ncbi:MAG: glutathione S-transferase N-terminal domain-containing protein [Burkholderiales bacterium]|nr:glutathione S-transferase N-terminal domain-containing protein [Burkholderiales bacterium]
MKLYIHPHAPNPNRVRLYLAEKQAGGAVIDLPQVKVDLRSGEQNSPAFLARNSFGAVPVLELDDGSYINESLTITSISKSVTPSLS